MDHASKPTATDPEETLHDALVIGGGPAGLQAALTLARVHREVVLVDDDRPRNSMSAHMHNVISLDGSPPAEFRAQGRRDLAAYDTVTLLDDAVRSLDRTDDGFLAHTESGAELRARRVVLATGVRDELPDVPGLAELWGTLVHHCPFCHGHELAGGRIGLLAGPNADHLTELLAPVAEVVVLDGVIKATEEGGG